MTDYNDQVNHLWDKWIAETGQDSGDPGEFVDWATGKRLLALGPQDMKQLLRKKVTQALRQARRFDDAGGFFYRAKQSVTLFDYAGLPIKHYFDTDNGGSPALRQRATRQRREAIAHDVYRAVCDAEHMSKVFSEDPQLNFFKDFTDDVEDMRAADHTSIRKDYDEEAA